MESTLPETIQELETPCMLVDIDVVKENCKRMTDICEQMGVNLRPHMKTNKTIEGGELMTNGTRRRIVVSTIDEAQFYANNGFEDILWATSIVKEKVSKRLISLANEMAEFHVMFSTKQGLDGLMSTPLNPGKKWSVFLEVDCGYGRTGCHWDGNEAVMLARQAAEGANTTFQGLYVHCGNAYDRDPVRKSSVQQETCSRLLSLKKRLEDAGVECKTYGSGSTPSCSKPIEDMKTLTEFHPGNYIFYDYSQVLFGSCEIKDIACRVATTVVGHKSNTLLIDCGWMALTVDGINETLTTPRGVAPVDNHPELKLIAMTQEVGKLTTETGDINFEKYPLGTRFYLYPWLACATASQHPVYYIHSGDKVLGTWKPTRGW